MNIALWIIYVLTFISLLFNANQHGEPRKDTNFWASLISTIITLILIWWALGWNLY